MVDFPLDSKPTAEERRLGTVEMTLVLLLAAVIALIVWMVRAGGGALTT